MLSPKNLLRTILSLVLIFTFTTSSLELRIAVATILSWALGLILHHNLALSTTFLRRHALFIFTTFWLLAAYNKLFYESLLAPLLDLLSEYEEEMEWLMGIFRIIFSAITIITITLSLIIAKLLDSFVKTPDPSSAKVKAQVPAPEPEPKHDTRYVYLSDELIFVCGRYGRFESVVAGDLEGAIRRRRPLELVLGGSFKNVVAGDYISGSYGRRMRSC